MNENDCQNEIRAVLDEGSLGPDRKYVDLKLVGAGGMGAVFKATKKGTDEPVAVKVLFLSGAGDEADVRARIERFQREASLMANLRSPHLVKAVDFFDERSATTGRHRCCYEMERCLVGKEEMEDFCRKGNIPFPFDDDGPWPRSVTLADLLHALRVLWLGTVPQRTVAAFARQLVLALRTAHETKRVGKKFVPGGVVHRDVKPDNVLIGPDGNLKLADFGIARLADDLSDPADAAQAAVEASRFSGTPGYRAPEQCKSWALQYGIGPAADYYALGVVLYELLTGRRLAFGTTDDDWVDPSTRGDELSPVSRHWDVLLRGMQEPDPTRRLADPDLLLREFGEIENGRA